MSLRHFAPKFGSVQRVAVIATREVKRFVAFAAKRASRDAEGIRKQRLSFRPLTEAETGDPGRVELLAASSGVRRDARS